MKHLSNHLSAEQISDWILGERSTGMHEHLQSCLKCSQDIARLEQGLLEFKGAVHEWAEQPVPLRIPARQPSWKWAAAAAAATAIALLPMYFEARTAQREAESAQDALLLNRVQARLSRTVPEPMEQLMKLMNEGKEGPQ